MSRVQKRRKDEQCCQTAAVCIKIVSGYRWLYSLFSICSKETLRIMYQKYPVLNIILEESTSVVDHSHQ